MPSGDPTPRFRPSRRDVLRAAAAASVGLVPALRADAGPADAGRFNPWWMRAFPSRSTVIEIASEKVLTGTKPEPVVLTELLRRALLALNPAHRPGDAWRAVVGEARRIAIKFNSVGAGVIATTDVFAQVLVRELTAAGYPAASIALIEAPAGLAQRFDARQPADGWGASIPVGEESEQLANWLLEADAVINVPFLKTHQIAGMSCCCKNLSHAVIRRPARYHANGCAPFIGHVVGSEPLSNRLKLNIVNALRIVAEGGPDATDAGLYNAGTLLLGFDPVAVDSVASGLLGVVRRRFGLQESITERYLEPAAADGVGRADRTAIDRRVV